MTQLNTDFYDFSYTAHPNNHWQTIGNYSAQESTEKGYNEKYNVDQVPEDSITVSLSLFSIKVGLTEFSSE